MPALQGHRPGDQRHTTEVPVGVVMELKYQTVHETEQRPDVYAGPNCDQIEPRWIGNVDGEGWVEVGLPDGSIAFMPEHFPPGTRVIVQEPECPECAEIASLCSCGFDWEQWARIEYS